MGAFSKDATKAAPLFTSGVYPISDSFKKLTEMTSSPLWDRMKAANCYAFMDDDNELNDAEVEVSNQSNGAAEDEQIEVSEKETGND